VVLGESYGRLIVAEDVHRLVIWLEDLSDNAAQPEHLLHQENVI